ncbi:MAG: hypothetical protein WC385_03035 [Candidatus Paceibacterota bacterium]|jgi:hypothetical protein
MNKKAIIFSVAISLFMILALVFLPSNAKPVKAQEADTSLHGWAWSSNIGWISVNSNDSDAASSQPYSVIKNSDGTLSGYAWSSNIGWVKFDPEGPYPADPQTGATLGADGHVTGWIRACAGAADPESCSGGANALSGGWDGWIKMDPKGAVDLDANGDSIKDVYFNSTTKKFSGFAWGGLNLGWVKFNAIEPTGGGPSCSDPVPPPGCPVTCPGCGGPSVTTVSCNAVASSTPNFITWNATPNNTESYIYAWSNENNDYGEVQEGSTEGPSFTTLYSEAGLHSMIIDVTDSLTGNWFGSSTCSTSVANDCTRDGIAPSEPPEANKPCCSPDGDGNGLCGTQASSTCSFFFASNPARISLTFINPLPGQSYFSTPNNSLGVDAGDCQTLALTSTGFPTGSSMVCSIDGGNNWNETCDNLSGAAIKVGVKAVASQIIRDELGLDGAGAGCKWVTITNSATSSNSFTRKVCFYGTFGN